MSILHDDYGLSLIGFLLAVITILTLVCGLVMVPVYFIEKNTCDEVVSAMDRDGYYGFWEGCMVKVDNSYFPLDQLRENQ